jgi:hypothetical protein
MPIIKCRNKEEVQQWKNVISSFETMIQLANQESESVKLFCDSQLDMAKFWKQYAIERTNDSKLREIAINDLKQVESLVESVGSIVPDLLNKTFAFLKQLELEN